MEERDIRRGRYRTTGKDADWDLNHILANKMALMLSSTIVRKEYLNQH